MTALGDNTLGQWMITDGAVLKELQVQLVQLVQSFDNFT